MTEDLNIPRATRALCVRALNKTGGAKPAAHAMGISERTIYRYMSDFNILKDRRTGNWYYVDRSPMPVIKIASKTHDNATVGVHR